VALFLGALGLLVVVQAVLLPESKIARGPVGPAAIPIVVGTLLVVVAAFLALDVSRGGRGEPEGGEDVELGGGTDWRTVLVLAAAFVSNALLIEPLGWPFSGAILFWGSAFALGSRRYIRDAVIALVLSFGSWYLFAFGLGVILPVGILKGIL
jgi:putative tricarboxylic transport membrane protein